ncbi:MAG: GspH/FimT family pseudopilin [Candidatus Eisenbacteria bacterium]|nr:GspH/FimT family pseudopilin [Candidatus Eisenbacteria bacterium]
MVGVQMRSIHPQPPERLPGAPGQSGFSLVELMFTLTLAGILLTFGIPAFLHYRQSTALPAESMRLAGQLKLARQVAISRSARYGVQVDSAGARYRVVDPTTDSVGPWIEMSHYVGFCRVEAPSPGSRFIFSADGRTPANGQVILAGAAGTFDTIGVSLSGRVSNP